MGTRARFVPKSGIRPPAVEDGMTADLERKAQSSRNSKKASEVARFTGRQH
jgi:hypothetical protein